MTAAHPSTECLLHEIHSKNVLEMILSEFEVSNPRFVCACATSPQSKVLPAETYPNLRIYAQAQDECYDSVFGAGIGPEVVDAMLKVYPTPHSLFAGYRAAMETV